MPEPTCDYCTLTGRGEHERGCPQYYDEPGTQTTAEAEYWDGHQQGTADAEASNATASPSFRLGYRQAVREKTGTPE